jgi:redox-sensitive bicupin YhaK (pirin superfamily)
MTHRDSICVEQVIRPGAVNWMTSGSGISHSERFDTLREKGGPMHGIQAWVAMPAEDEERAPSFNHHDASELPVFHDKGIEARLIAGTAYGLRNNVKTTSPLFYLHAEMQNGGTLTLPPDYKERGAYVVRGSIEHEGRTYNAGSLLVFSPGPAQFSARETSCVMLLGGEPLGPRHIWWNFVSSRKERIEQAKADWQAGRFKLPIHDNLEFIPLPDEPKPHPPEAEAMS